MIDSVWVNITESQLLGIKSNLDSLQNQLTSLQDKNDLLTGILETSNDSIANQLSAANNLLAFIAIAITLVGAIAGFYIRKKKLEVEEMVKNVDEKKKTVDAIAETTKELDCQINSNLKELYTKLRREETYALLDRLILEPRDVCNLIQLLLARDLEEDGFVKIREAFFKLEAELKGIPEEETSYIKDIVSERDDYILLFFQHYCCQAVKDDQIRPLIVGAFSRNCKRMFKRDVIKTTIDLCKALSDATSTFNKEEVLTAYLKALDECKHKRLDELKNILEQNITPPSLLEKAKAQCAKDGLSLSLFGAD